MTDRLDLDGFDRQLGAFSDREVGLRGSTAGTAGGGAAEAGRADELGMASALEAALLELAVAEEELRVARDELLTRRDRPGADPVAERERKLLRAVLGELPVPVFLLERDGIVRRANRAACELVDTPAAYPVGKPFTSFVSQRDRGALRFAVSAAAAGSRGTPVRGAVLAQGRPRDVVLRLAPLRLPGEVDPLVAVVAIAVGPGSSLGAGLAAAALTGLDGPAPAGGLAAPPDAPARARRMDVMASLARLLLDPPAGGEAELLERAAELLTAGLAASVLVDLTDDRDVLTRRVVAGGSPVGERPAGERPAGERPAGERPAGERPAGERPAGERPAGDRLVGVPVGRHTLPGRVAAGRRAQLASRLEHPADLGTLPDGGTVGAALGATSAAAAPLLPPGPDATLLGVVTLVRRDGRPYDLAELGLLEQLCEHLALALRAGRAARRRTEVAEALRAGLLPRRLPEPDGLRIAAAFRAADLPADRDGPVVGGDFYDALPAGDGWAVVLGDVSGRDEQAAALTAAVRHSLGVLAHTERRPEVALCRVNAYLRARGGDRFATVLLARLTRRGDGWRATLAGAGHPPALVVPADGPVTPIPAGGRPLGLFEDPGATATTVDLGPGDMLLLHSDGVTGARSPAGRPFGDDALGAVAAAVRDGAHQLVDAVRDAVVLHAGGRLRDDVSLLAVRVTG